MRIARARGLVAFTSDEFIKSDQAVKQGFDSLLFAHVFEHMDEGEGQSLLRHYLPFLAPDGAVCFITPQERGFRTDATHVRFVDFADLRRLAKGSELTVAKSYSFPFPRFAGTIFAYNEFVVIARAK